MTKEPETKVGRGWRAGFWSLIVTQFQTAFNDNAVKFLVIYIIVAMNFPNQFRDRLILAVGALFAIPFILFSMTGGYFADRYSKRSVTIGTKFLELGVIAFTILALYLRNLPMECASVFLISMEAALFGPSKYGLLPELLPDHRLSWGNGVIELGTFVASISATMAAGIMAERYRGREAVAGFLLLAFTFVGLVTSFGISHLPAADPHRKFRWDPLGELIAQLKIIYADLVLFWSVMGNTYLWFLAALLQFTIVVYGHDVLHIDDTRTSYLQAAVGIGIGIGSLAAGYLSRGKIEMGLIPIGALGMTIFGALLYFRQPAELLADWLSTAAFHQGSTAAVKFGNSIVSAVRLRIPDLSLLGFFGGFFAVPLNALIQHRPRSEHKGGVIAAANLLSFVGIFIAAGAYYFFSTVFHQTPAGVFLDGSILTLVITAASIYLLRDSLFSFFRKSQAISPE
jgi:acyl-[acyl-carrier-protein]-phospholipid O-acyltransferase / long-chain-fatty-acid--[acyl-carrier-protein] ligase